jgi:WhiB family redox-sensing transcriptional regulator
VRLLLDVHWTGDEFTQPDISRTGGPLFGSHFENVPRVGTWAALGVCRDATAAFFPERGQRFDAAVALCNDCPVREPCRAYGLAHSSLKGIFGGLTEDERRRVRAEARRIGESIRDPRAAELYNVLFRLLRYPVRTWATIATTTIANPARGELDRVAEGLSTRQLTVPPGAWEFAVVEGAVWELWARLNVRNLPGSRRRERPPRLGARPARPTTSR